MIELLKISESVRWVIIYKTQWKKNSNFLERWHDIDATLK